MATLDCFMIDSSRGPLDIRPAPSTRPWMDETKNALAYRCLPLVMANQHGWQIHAASDITATWNGGNGVEDVEITGEQTGLPWAISHFGSGTLTFEFQAVLRTEPGYNLWLSGPPNTFVDGAEALSAMIETDWLPFSFSVNWKLTRPGLAVQIRKGDPLCVLFPVRRGDIETFAPRMRSISEDPDLHRQFASAKLRRTAYKRVDPRNQAEGELYYQRWYTRGEYPDGENSFAEHQKALALAPFSGPGSED